MRQIPLLGLVAACLWASSALHAQDAPRVIQPGERIRLVLRGVEQARGQFESSTADSVVLRTARDTRRAVARSEVRAVQLSDGRSVLRGMRNVFLGVGTTTWVVCSVVIGIAATAENGPEALLYAPLFCLPGAAVYGAVGALMFGPFAAEQWVDGVLPASASNPVEGH